MQTSTLETKAERRRLRASPEGRRVLIVDDEANLREGLASFVSDEGYEVRTASGGAPALELVRTWTPDVVISDLAMPNMNGIELCNRLHEQDPLLPVIILTAMDHADAGLACLEAGAEDYLCKPVQVAAVAWSLQRALERRESTREREQLSARTDELCEQLRELNEHLVVSGIREQERVEAEEQRQAELNALLQRLSEGIIVVDVSGQVRMINDAACSILGVGRELSDVASLRALDLRDAHGKRLGSDDRPIERALRGQDFAGYGVTYVLPSGEQRCLETTGTSVRSSLGAVAVAIVVLRDVTELRRLEQHREEYLALISHDLRTPLNVILMSAQLLREAHATQRDVECIGRLERNAQRMAAMLEELTDATRLEQGSELTRTHCDLGTLVSDVIAQLDDTRARRISFEALGTEPFPVMADPPQLARCILNLLTNALKYSSPEAPVQIRLSRVERHMRLEVIDHGIGIAPEALEHVFDRYYRTSSGRAQAEGLGLGLYITRLIAEAHGGRAEVRSAIGEGSTFTLTLPLRTPAAADVRAHAIVQPRASDTLSANIRSASSSPIKTIKSSMK